MKLRPMTVLHLRRMRDRVEMKIALCTALVLVALSFGELCARFYGFERDALPSAAYGWIGNMDVMQITAIHIGFYLLFFILSASVYADSVEADRKRQTASPLATRTSMADYVRSSACVTFVGGGRSRIRAARTLTASLCSYFPWFPRSLAFSLS